jgi:hypothetical protein
MGVGTVVRDHTKVNDPDTIAFRLAVLFISIVYTLVYNDFKDGSLFCHAMDVLI